MNNPDHVVSPLPHAGPFAGLRDDELTVAYESVVLEPDSQVGPMLLAELRHRGLVE